MIKLNLGCGKDIRKDYLNADKALLPGVNVVCNIENGLPFKSNVFDTILCKHVLEHLNDFMSAMDDLHRILKNNGVLDVVVPYCSSVNAYADPTHKRFFAYKTMDCFEKDSACDFYTETEFKIIRRKLHFSGDPRLDFLNNILNPIINKAPVFYERFFLWILPVNKIFFTMKAVK
ncbi:MAG: methyltransferase domain-containing protein [bacterium]|nr:methyltransferase domain-containing protein [bacterium]